MSHKKDQYDTKLLREKKARPINHEKKFSTQNPVLSQAINQ